MHSTPEYIWANNAVYGGNKFTPQFQLANIWMQKSFRQTIGEVPKAHLILSRASDELEISSLKKISLLLCRATFSQKRV